MALTIATEEKKLTRVAASYISSEGPDIHLAVGGSSQFIEGRGGFVPRDFHASLEELLQRCLPETLNLKFQQDATVLEELSERLTGTQSGYESTRRGFWHSLWYRVGNERATLDGWMALLPNEYGLSVVKLGLAVVFKLAERSAETRHQVLVAFTSIRDALAKADPAKRSFRGSKETLQCADRLTQTIVDCIEGMILLTAKRKGRGGNWIRLKRRNQNEAPVPKLEEILGQLEGARMEFERVLNLVRDNVIESTGIMTQAMLPVIHIGFQRTERQLATIGKNYKVLERELHVIASSVSAQSRQIAERERSIEAAQILTRDSLHEILKETKKEAVRERDEVWRRRLRGQRLLLPENFIEVDELLQILAMSDSDSESDLPSLLNQPNHDLQQTLSFKRRLNRAIQDQTQASVLRNSRVLQWLSRPRSDLIMINANINDVAQPKTSAISVFCATLVTGIISSRPEDVVAHCFCGLHVQSHDIWNGPCGLVRLLAMQLLTRLTEMEQAETSFINSRDYLAALEQHDLSTLCDLLYSLIAQFPADTTIFLIIDSISRVDIPSTSPDLALVMDCLYDIITDPVLEPTVKVFLTNPKRCKTTLRDLAVFQDGAARLVDLLPNTLGPTPPMSERVISRQLLRYAHSSPDFRRRSVGSAEAVEEVYEY